MGKFTNGIAEIGFGDIGSQGEIATSFKPLGWTMEDSFKIISEEGSKTEFMVEEIDSPVFVTKKAGSFGFEFELADADVDALVYFFGGSKSGTTYQAPDAEVSIEKSVRVKPRQGYGFDVTRALITANFVPDYGRNSLMRIKINIQVLAPTKKGAKRFEMPYYAPAG
ncbi:hypothetical protein ACT8O7_08020 [Ornithobacterium rhinotracheale]|uniref:hypothetical protein n=1 Tax=Ornithobacterium rhinotracheale TaxID=28251 RepID=UPI0040356B78